MARRTRNEIITSLQDTFGEISPQIRIDTDKGPFFNLSIRANAVVLDEENANTERVALLSTFQFPSVATEEEKEGTYTAFSVGAEEGGFSTGDGIFFTTRRPQGDDEFVVAEGDAVSTAESDGVVFIAVESRTLNNLNADLFFNAQTRRFELPVPVRAAQAGAAGNIAASNLRSIVSGASNFDGVTNIADFDGGGAQETSDNAYARVQQKLTGLDQLSIGGMKSRGENIDTGRVTAVELTYSTEYPFLYFRLPDGPGIDVIVLNTAQSASRVESFAAVGGETEFTLPEGPVLSLGSVLINGVPDTGASLILDESPSVGRSTREESRVSFSTTLAEDDDVEVTYTVDAILQNIQNDFDGIYRNNDTDSDAVFSTDVLVRYPRDLYVAVTVTGTVLGTTDTSAVEAEVTSIIDTYMTDGSGTPTLGGTRSAEELSTQIKSLVPGIASLSIDVFGRKTFGQIVEVIDVPRNSVPAFEATSDISVKFT